MRSTVKIIAVLVCSCFVASMSFAQGLTLASGWSEKPTEAAAIKEAAASIVAGTAEKPRFVVLFSRSGYDFSALATESAAAWPGAKVFGVSVQHAVFTKEGIHRGEKSALAALAFSTADMAVGVGAVKLTGPADTKGINQAISEAVADAKKTKGDKPSIVLLGSTDQCEEAIIAGVTSYFGKDVQIMGGTAVKEDGAKGAVIANGKAVDAGFAIAVLYAKTPVGAAFHSGFISKTVTGKVTAAEGRLLKQIDGKPAFEVYQAWTSPQFDKLDLSKSPDISLDAAKLPLAKSISTSDGSSANIVAVPFVVGPDKSMRMGVAFAVGDTISLVTGSAEALIKRAGTVAQKAMVDGKIKKNSIAGGIQIYCVGAALIGIGKDKIAGIPAEIAKEMGDAPFIGGFFGGEQGTYAGFGSCHANLTSDMVVFGK